MNKEALAFMVKDAIKNYRETGFGMTKYECTTVIADTSLDGMSVAIYEDGLLVRRYIQQSV